MIYKTYNKGNYKVIKINETLTFNSTVDELTTIVDNLLKKEIINIAIHFEDNSFLCSASGTVMVRCWESIKDHNGSLALVNVNKDIYNLLKVIDFDSVIKVYASDEELEFEPKES